jgi:hypothetical protein
VTKNDYLALQVNIICLLLALIGSTAIIEHPAWFGSTNQTSIPARDITVPSG